MSRRSSAAAGLLGRIVAAKRAEVERLAPRRAELRRAAETAEPARPFAAALAGRDTVTVIAEFKRRSPSAGPLTTAEAGADDVVRAARRYASAGAAAMSVLTDRSFFGGSLDDLSAARAACALPVLRKDFVTDALHIWEARAAGADAVLLIVRILDDARLREFVALAAELGFAALVEVHDATELARALAAAATLVGVNNRNLATFETDLGISLELAPQVPAGRIVVAESGIAAVGDVARLAEAGVDAVLVGESLMRASDSGLLLGELANVQRRGRGLGARTRARTRVKICGVCRPEDAAAALAAGADYVGVILSAGHARTRSLAEAAAIYRAAPGAWRVGVFVDDDARTVVAAAERLRLDVVQLHGDESVDDVRAIAGGATQVWKAIRPRDGAELVAAVERYGAHVDGLLLEGWSARGAGGVGARFPWELADRARAGLAQGVDLVAAGGLRAENVGELVQRLRPDVVDVSSGVEEAVGRKSEAMLRAFVAAASREF